MKTFRNSLSKLSLILDQLFLSKQGCWRQKRPDNRIKKFNNLENSLKNNELYGVSRDPIIYYQCDPIIIVMRSQTSLTHCYASDVIRLNPQFNRLRKNKELPEYKMKIRTLLIILLSFSLSGCGEKLKNDTVPRGGEPVDYVVENADISTLDTRVSIHKNELQEMLASFPKRHRIDDNFDIADGQICPCIGGGNLGTWSIGGHASGWFVLTGTAKVHFNNKHPDRIYLTLPLSVDVTVKTRGTIKIQETIDGKLDLTVSLKPQINEDWSINSNVQVTHKWTKAPSFVVGNDITGRHRVTVQGAADKALESLKKDIAKEINKSANSQLNAKPMISEAWKKAHLLEKVADQDAWVAIKPLALSLVNPSINGDSIIFDAGIAAKVSTFFGSKPELGEATKLPSPKIVKSLTPAFNVTMPLVVDYSKLSEAVSQQVVGTPWNYEYGDNGKVTVTFQKLDIFPSQGRIAIYTEFSADVPGKWADTDVELTLLGDPVFDNNSKIISIEDLDFALDADNDLIGGADWLLHDVFKAYLQKMAKVDLSEDYVGAIERANREIDNAEIDSITLKGTVKGIGIDKIAVLEKAIVLPLNCTGSLSVQVK